MGQGTVTQKRSAQNESTSRMKSRKWKTPFCFENLLSEAKKNIYIFFCGITGTQIEA
jgi:hypothetical protein